MARIINIYSANECRIFVWHISKGNIWTLDRLKTLQICQLHQQLVWLILIQHHLKQPCQWLYKTVWIHVNVTRSINMQDLSRLCVWHLSSEVCWLLWLRVPGISKLGPHQDYLRWLLVNEICSAAIVEYNCSHVLCSHIFKIHYLSLILKNQSLIYYMKPQC